MRRGSSPHAACLAQLTLACLLCVGCLRKELPVEGPAVTSVELQGTDAVAPGPILSGLSTAESARFLGIWDGVAFEYEVFEESLLEKDLERVERYYRARGYYEAKVTAARVLPAGDRRVRVEIRVSEGPPVITEHVSPQGLQHLPIDVAVAAMEAITLEPGARFDEQVYTESKQAMVDALADRGYAFVRIEGRTEVDLARHLAKVRLEVHPGPRAHYGEVRIVGLKKVPEGPVRDSLGVVEGGDYSQAELRDARNALINLGVFSTVAVEQDTSKPKSAKVPVTVIVEESALRALRLGGGSRFDVLELSGHLRVGWEHRNFLGGLRHFSVETKPGVVLFPTRMDSLATPTHALPKNRLRVSLQQPSFLEGRTKGFVGGEFNVYPVLYPDLTEKDNVVGFLEVTAQTGLERAFFDHHLYATLAYNWRFDDPIAYLGENRLKDSVTVSYPELTTVLDFRDSQIDPRSGVFLENSAQIAGYAFGGDASDVKLRPELRTYFPVEPVDKEWTLATRATLGLLFPSSYGHTLTADPATHDPSSPESLRDQQLLLVRAFYSGGPTSNRGYPFRGVGPHGPVGFLLPTTVRCDPGDTRSECLRPLGGLTLWEASLELRFPLLSPLRGAIFIDGSDVRRHIASITFDTPHLSPGMGLRYLTPVGPLRIDVGYRLPWSAPDAEARQEGDPGTIVGLPIAIHFGLGEAF